MYHLLEIHSNNTPSLRKNLRIEIQYIGIVSNEDVIASFPACSIFWHEFCV